MLNMCTIAVQEDRMIGALGPSVLPNLTPLSATVFLLYTLWFTNDYCVSLRQVLFKAHLVFFVPKDLSCEQHTHLSRPFGLSRVKLSRS